MPTQNGTRNFLLDFVFLRRNGGWKASLFPKIAARHYSEKIRTRMHLLSRISGKHRKNSGFLPDAC
jgi:replication initiation and membrane attachment protein DnaB